jgi:hypothetical protein
MWDLLEDGEQAINKPLRVITGDAEYTVGVAPRGVHLMCA